jgi:tetratricopeptide (TPR) repeat protein
MSRRKAESRAGIQKAEEQRCPVQARVPFSRVSWAVVLISLLLILAIVAVFWPVKNFPFVSLDDNEYVTENPQVLNGLSLSSVVWAFTTKRCSNWHPLTWLSHMLDIELYGLNPGGHHLTNLFFHLANTLLVLWVFKGMTGMLWRSGFVALLFALHPLHVESVAWVAERKDVLSTFFWMLTIMAYVRYAHQTSLKRYLLVFLSFALGLMSKPMLVTLPFVLLLLDYWPLGRLHWRLEEQRSQKKAAVSRAFRLLWEKVPLLILVVVSCVLTIWAQRRTVASLEELPIGIRTANALMSYVKYIGKMIWPFRLAIQYPYPERFLLWQLIWAGFFLVGVSIWVVREGRRRPYLGVGWFWYLGTLVPVIGLVQVGTQAMADRYTYIPLIGLFVMMVWGIPEFLTGRRYRRMALPASATLVIVLLTSLTRIQLQYWHDSNRLYQHSLDVTKKNYQIHYNLGVTLTREGRNEEAKAEYAEVLKIKPDYYKALSAMGVILERQRKYAEAIAYFKEALRINPDHEDTYYNLGRAFFQLGRYEDAIKAYKEVLRIKPDDADTYVLIGIALTRQGKYDEAVASQREAIRIKPNLIDAHNNLGIALALQGKHQEAIDQFNEVLRIKPNIADTYYNIGLALTEEGNIREAIDQFSKALRIKPDFGKARFSLVQAYLKIGNRDLALEEYKILKTTHPDLANDLSQRLFK